MARKGFTLLELIIVIAVLAILMALVAGLLGMLLGAGATYLVRVFFHWPIFVSPAAVALAFGSSSAVGVFFGFYPSLRASRLDPIAALRND